MLSTLFDLDKVQELLTAKIQHGQLLLFNLPGFYCVFRPLTVGEVEALSALSSRLSETAIEDWVVKTTLIVSNKSADYVLNKTGYLYVTFFAQKVMLASNIKEEKDFKEALFKARGEMTTPIANIDSLIAAAFQMDRIAIKKMTQYRQFELLAFAEKITGNSLQLGDPDRQRNNRQLRKFADDAVVIGGDITSPEAADIPDFDEEIP